MSRCFSLSALESIMWHGFELIVGEFIFFCVPPFLLLKTHNFHTQNRKGRNRQELRFLARPPEWDARVIFDTIMSERLSGTLGLSISFLFLDD